MKKILILVLAVAAWMLPAAAEETIVKLKTDVLSDYIFRGQELNDSPVMQSQVDIQHGIFDLRLWGNMDLTARQESELNFTEFNLDFKLEKQVYDNPKGKVLTAASLFGGVKYYSFPEIGKESTTEVYTGVDVTTLFKLHSRTTLFYDIDEAEGGYVSEDVYRKFDLPFSFKLFGQEFKVSATPEVGIGWGSHDYNQYHWNVSDSSLTDWHAGLSLLAESKRFEFGPSIRFTDLIDGDIQDRQNDSSNLVYGFSFGMKF